MEINRPSSNILELRDGGAAMIVLGAVFVAMGVAALVLIVVQHIVTFAIVPAIVFAALGVICLRRTQRTTHVIDGRRGTLTIASSSVFGRGETTVTERHRLETLAAVALEERESIMDDNPSTVYRVAYVFADGSRRPWTQYWTSRRMSHEEPRAAVEAFLIQSGYLGARDRRRAAGA